MVLFAVFEPGLGGCVHADRVVRGQIHGAKGVEKRLAFHCCGNCRREGLVDLRELLFLQAPDRLALGRSLGSEGFEFIDPFTEPGDMALFVYTYDYATDGYKVFFDNVIVE